MRALKLIWTPEGVGQIWRVSTRQTICVCSAQAVRVSVDKFIYSLQHQQSVW